MHSISFCELNILGRTLPLQEASEPLPGLPDLLTPLAELPTWIYSDSDQRCCICHVGVFFFLTLHPKLLTWFYDLLNFKSISLNNN